MSHVRSEARNAARRLADLRERAAAAGLDIEEYARRRAAKAAMKAAARAAARAAKAAAAVRKPLPPDSPRTAVAATAEGPLQASPERPWLIDGTLRRSSLTLMDGPDPAATFALALDMSIALASGVGAWGGKAIQTSRTKVLLLDLLFTTDIGSRVRATELMRRVDTNGRLRISRGSLLIGSRKSNASFVAGVQEAGAPAVIIINHFARLCETSALDPQDQSAMTTLADALKLIRARLGGCALLVLGGADSLLGPVADRILHVQREGQLVTMTAAGMSPISFRMAQTRGVTLPVAVDTVSTSSKKGS